MFLKNAVKKEIIDTLNLQIKTANYMLLLMVFTKISESIVILKLAFGIWQ